MDFDIKSEVCFLTFFATINSFADIHEKLPKIGPGFRKGDLGAHEGAKLPHQNHFSNRAPFLRLFERDNKALFVKMYRNSAINNIKDESTLFSFNKNHRLSFFVHLFLRAPSPKSERPHQNSTPPSLPGLDSQLDKNLIRKKISILRFSV